MLKINSFTHGKFLGIAQRYRVNHIITSNSIPWSGGGKVIAGGGGWLAEGLNTAVNRSSTSFPSSSSFVRKRDINGSKN